MKTRKQNLPKHIYALPSGYDVQVWRGGKVRFRGFIPYTATDALTRALALRDRFLAAAEVASHRHAVAYSNTGIPGISETIRWKRNRPTNCFNVFLGKDRRPRHKDVFYGRVRSRAAALSRAIELRRAVGGVIPVPVEDAL